MSTSGRSPAEAKTHATVSGDLHDSSANASSTDTSTAAFSRGSGVTEDYYKPIDTYEGNHRYDPHYTWEPSEGKRLVRKSQSESERTMELPKDTGSLR
ncbi:hypothetical protein BDZ91DRAFT_798813 [Kalaharituber pfeilii]|nr:hypothetical protein BDZ91DRAFT_798813 [Kalaharituber pfeilii]